VLYLGLPVIGSTSPGNTAFLSATDITATAGQTVFASAGSYTPGFVQVYRNGARLGAADFTATNGTTITLTNAAVSGDLVTIEYYTLTSLVNALPLTGGTVTGSTTFNNAVTINGAASSGYTGMKNRIINGNMVADQRNAGAAVTQGASVIYTVDRWWCYGSTASKFTVQRSTVVPTGFTNSLLCTSSSAYTPASTDEFDIAQYIEGFNTADFGWGAAEAASVTLSFQVRSSLTGVFGGQIANSNSTRSYPFSYTISAANTWETKTVVIPGDTTGTWGTGNGAGVLVLFSLGAGATKSGTANAWQGANYTQPTGSVSVVGTSGATWYVTGIQLERGTNATSFEFIDYGRQLVQCQRYLPTLTASSSGTVSTIGAGTSTTSARVVIPFTVTPRVSPTGVTVISVTNFGLVSTGSGGVSASSITFDSASFTGAAVNVTVGSGMTANGAHVMYQSSPAQLFFTGCEL
jgi:hypothetical protein